VIVIVRLVAARTEYSGAGDAVAIGSAVIDTSLAVFRGAKANANTSWSRSHSTRGDDWSSSIWVSNDSEGNIARSTMTSSREDNDIIAMNTKSLGFSIGSGGDSRSWSNWRAVDSNRSGVSQIKLYTSTETSISFANSVLR
jgi:hypothetical protein